MEIESFGLRLSDYDKIWSKFCFLDETGSLADWKDPYFTLGILKMSQPYYLQSKISYERNRRNFHDELKFNKLSRLNIDFAKWVLNSLFETRSINFYSLTIRKGGAYFMDNLNSDQWSAYENLTIRLLDMALGNSEILILIADHITVPKEIKFEVNTKKNFNTLQNRFALAGVCRFDSKSNDLLQVVDLLIGAITYDVKYTNAIVSGSRYKIELVDFLKKLLGVDTFEGGFRGEKFWISLEEV
ncbi:MAG: DUF3800 domain-containing protein [Candidatus Paceibacterota bacterium]|jgi:hypothetical protein